MSANNPRASTLGMKTCLPVPIKVPAKLSNHAYAECVKRKLNEPFTIHFHFLSHSTLGLLNKYTRLSIDNIFSKCAPIFSSPMPTYVDLLPCSNPSKYYVILGCRLTLTFHQVPGPVRDAFFFPRWKFLLTQDYPGYYPGSSTCHVMWSSGKKLYSWQTT